MQHSTDIKEQGTLFKQKQTVTECTKEVIGGDKGLRMLDTGRNMGADQHMKGIKESGGTNKNTKGTGTSHS